MNKELTKWAAAAVLSIAAAAPAFGGSVTRPGDTIGLPVGVPLPEGLYLGNNTTYERRDTSPSATYLLVDAPIFVWSTPWTIFGARVEPSFGPVVPLKIHSGATKSRRVKIHSGPNEITGKFNSFGALS